MAPNTATVLSYRTADVATLCAEIVGELGVSGASITVVSTGGRQSTLWSTDHRATRAEALQFELGEGPHWDALASGEPVLAPDLGSGSDVRWQAFQDGITGLGIHGLFAIPMMMRGARVGVVNFHETRRRIVDDEFVAQACFAASRVAPICVRAAVRSAKDYTSHETLRAPALRREVHQATGVIEAQRGLSAVDAFGLMQGHSFASGRPIDGIARDVVTGRLTL